MLLYEIQDGRRTPFFYDVYPFQFYACDTSKQAIYCYMAIFALVFFKGGKIKLKFDIEIQCGWHPHCHYTVT